MKRAILANGLQGACIGGVLGVLAYAFIGAPMFGMRLGVFWLCWPLVFGVFWAALPRVLSGVQAPIVVGLWVLCAVWLLAEAGLELLVRVSPSPVFARVNRDVEELIRQKSRPPGVSFLGFPFNSDGWYDDEFGPRQPGVTRIASISDSFAWSAAPHYYHFTTVAERAAPGLEICNMGYSATGVDVYRHIVKVHAQRLQPDAILVNLFVGNDFHELLPSRDANRFLDRLRAKENLLTWQIPRRLYLLGREAARRKEEEGTGRGTANALQNVFTIGRGDLVPDDQLVTVYPWLADPDLEPATFSEAAYLEVERERAVSVCYRPILDEKWRAEFFGRLQRIVDEAGDIPVIFTIIPDEFQVENDLWGEVVKQAEVELERFLPQMVLLAWMQENNRPCIDLLPALLRTPPLEDGKRHLYHLRDSHFNRRGNEIAGREIAAQLARLGIWNNKPYNGEQPR